MKMKINLSFKRGPQPTGLASVAQPYASTDIKLNKVVVGWIQPPSGGGSLRQDPHWRVWTKRRKAVTKEKPSPFYNACFKATFDSEQEARDWVTRNWPAITSLDLYIGEKE